MKDPLIQEVVMGVQNVVKGGCLGKHIIINFTEVDRVST